jgi:hypothetical protein
LFLVLSFWVTLIKRGTTMLRGVDHQHSRALASAVLGLVFTYWLSNITNGQWQGGLANVTLALAAGLAALARPRHPFRDQVNPSIRRASRTSSTRMSATTFEGG